jgi:putrescine transport system substrate-binding protein
MRAVGMALGALWAGLAAFGAVAQQRTVNVYNWTDYIDPAILADFTAETGIRVVYDTFDGNEMLETRMLAGGSGYDVVAPSGTFLQRQIAAGVFQPLQKEKLPNLVHLWPEITARVDAYDPGGAYSITYMWGTTGIGYDVAEVRERLGAMPVDSWRVVFDPAILSKLADCGVHLLDQPDEMIPLALSYLGLDPDSKAAGDIERATAALTAIRPYVQKFHSSEYVNALAAGDICLAVGWSGDVLQARDRAAEAGAGVEIAYAIPKEGTQIWFDQLAIPADARNVDEAHAFIDYLMRPDVAARATDFVRYASGNLAAQAAIDPALLADPGVYPDAETMARLFVVTPYDARAQRAVTRAWTAIKSGS